MDMDVYNGYRQEQQCVVFYAIWSMPGLLQPMLVKYATLHMCELSATTNMYIINTASLAAYSCQCFAFGWKKLYLVPSMGCSP